MTWCNPKTSIVLLIVVAFISLVGRIILQRTCLTSLVIPNTLIILISLIIPTTLTIQITPMTLIASIPLITLTTLYNLVGDHEAKAVDAIAEQVSILLGLVGLLGLL